ncbi:MAG: porphobilinogen synthase, partial [Nitrospiraceae bacterium]
MRRLRQSEPLRQMLRETRLTPADLIFPLFVVEGRDHRQEIASM